MFNGWRNNVCVSSHLNPVVELIFGEVELHHVATEGCDGRPVPGCSDPTIAQNQRAGQVQAVCKYKAEKDTNLATFYKHDTGKKSQK